MAYDRCTDATARCPQFSVELVSLIRAEVRAAPKDIHLVLATFNTLANVLLFEEPARTDAFNLLLTLLCHRYPKVRLVCAETLHNQLVASGGAFVRLGNSRPFVD